MVFKKMLLLATVAILSHLSIFAQRNTDNVKADTIKVDTIKSRINRPKPYREIITDKAVSDDGLFIVHEVNKRYFFEIPDSLLGMDMLLVNRIGKASAGLRGDKYMYGYAGDYIGDYMLRFERGPNNKLFLKCVDYSMGDRSTDSNGLYNAVRNSNLLPIVVAFDIKAFNLDSTGVVIDVTDYINGDNPLFFFNGPTKKKLQIGGIQTDKSYVEKITSLPINIEIITVKTYVNEERTATYELNSSLILLPKEPMKPRYVDKRVGYFYQGYKDFDSPRGVENTYVITRFRLEPKDEDIERYKRGELVEPNKPIVFYIDPCTPKKWVPYLIQGVNDWQKAFEAAGFKNAIFALEVPANDPDFSLLDARHNAIIYKPSYAANAMGPHIHDPRSGEILEAHVNWYHNVMELIHSWYMIQAGPNDRKARQMVFEDSLMGQLIRFVSSHEVGHTLGLMHNFGASSTIPVEKLRDKKWVEENGFCPSIMDYARFNYVAQPEDSITEKGLMPRIGVYDKWAIEWGYKWLSGLTTKEQEVEYMNKWIIKRLGADPRLWYGPQPGFFTAMPDPRSQSEDLGDNATKAGYYGIQNLKRIIPQLKEWTKEPNSDYSALKEMTAQVLRQYQRYINHVLLNIGTPLWTNVTVEQEGERLAFPSKRKQKEAVQFLHDQLFCTPTWLQNKDIFKLTGYLGKLSVYNIQLNTLITLLSGNKYLEMSLWAPSADLDNAYTFEQLISDLEKGIFKELGTKAPISYDRRALQKGFVFVLYNISYYNYNMPSNQSLLNTDFAIIIKEQIQNLIRKISIALPGYQDRASILHLKDLTERLKNTLDPKIPNPHKSTFNSPNPSTYQIFDGWQSQLKSKSYRVSCWDEGLDQNLTENSFSITNQSIKKN